MKRWLPRVLIVTAALALSVIAVGQAGWLTGTPPSTLGVPDGRLTPPALSPNSVSSQANLYPDHPQRETAYVAPLLFSGDGDSALEQLATVIRTMPRARIVTLQPGYIRAEFQTPLLHYTDDLELWLDRANGVIQVRSASRIGESDLGVNRARVETIRKSLPP